MTNLLGGWQIKLIAAALILAAIAGLLWHDHHQTDRANRLARENATLAESIEAERENTRKANESAKRYEARSAELEASRRSDPLPAVRVCRSTARVPEAEATAVPHEAAEADNPPADEGDRDIGPALDDFATDAEANLIQCQELQRWVDGR